MTVAAEQDCGSGDGDVCDRKKKWCFPKPKPRLWVHIFLYPRHEDFDLVPTLIGRNGSGTKPIYEKTHCKVRIRGIGSKHYETHECTREAQVPLQVAVTSDKNSIDMFRLAVDMLVDELNVLSELYKRFCLQRSLPQPRDNEPLFAFGEACHDADVVLRDLIIKFPHPAGPKKKKASWPSCFGNGAGNGAGNAGSPTDAPKPCPTPQPEGDGLCLKTPSRFGAPFERTAGSVIVPSSRTYEHANAGLFMNPPVVYHNVLGDYYSGYDYDDDCSYDRYLAWRANVRAMQVGAAPWNPLGTVYNYNYDQWGYITEQHDTIPDPWAPSATAVMPVSTERAENMILETDPSRSSRSDHGHLEPVVDVEFAQTSETDESGTRSSATLPLPLCYVAQGYTANSSTELTVHEGEAVYVHKATVAGWRLVARVHVGDVSDPETVGWIPNWAVVDCHR